MFPSQLRGRRSRRAHAIISAAFVSLSLVSLSLVALSLVAGCGQGSKITAIGKIVATRSASTFPDKIYAYPYRALYAAVATLKADRHTAKAVELKALGAIPSGIWAAGQSGVMQQIKNITQAAEGAHAVPVIVAYNLPDRDVCGKYSAASGPTSQGYTIWINQLAAAVGSGHDIIVVEPDGLADILLGCLSPALVAVRYQLLRYAMQRLGSLPNAHVYLDAGNPGMFSDPALLADPLVRAGIRYGRGFSANVSNFQWTSTVVAWSQRLEATLGGSVGVLIDTSRNGNGPYTGSDAPQWCNPPGRAPGPVPQLDPGPAGIDGYLWIKNPGVSDGTCNGGPPAGQFWTQYAVGLAQSQARRA